MWHGFSAVPSYPTGIVGNDFPGAMVLIPFWPILLAGGALFAIVEWRWADRRLDQGDRPRSVLARSSFHVAVFAWVAIVADLTIFPIFTGETPLSARLADNFEPFVEIRRAWSNETLEQIWGNVALFIPFGVGGPLLWSRLDGPVRVVVAAILVSIGIEALQWGVFTHRQADIDDVILNVPGALAGYALLAVARVAARPRSSSSGTG